MYGEMDGVRTFVRTLVSKFALGPSLTRVGVVEFSSGAKTLGSLSGNSASVHASIDSVSDAGGWTDISSGLEQGQDLLRGGRGGRACGNNGCVMILLTDGVQSSRYGGDVAAIASAAQVKGAGVTLFAVGFGGVEQSALDAMASDPASRHSYKGSSIADIQAYFDVGFCQLLTGPAPPPLPPVWPVPPLPPPCPPSPPVPPSPPPRPPAPPPDLRFLRPRLNCIQVCCAVFEEVDNAETVNCIIGAFRRASRPFLCGPGLHSGRRSAPL